MENESQLESIVQKKDAAAGRNGVKAMVISEFPVDSIIGTSEQANSARKGILEYVRRENPDAIFVDGLISYIRFPEMYDTGILESEPIETFMKEPFALASKFMHEVRNASSGKVYYVLSDADEDNIRRLTRRTCNDRKKAVKALISKYEKGISECDKKIEGFGETTELNKEKITSEKKRKAAYQRHLNLAMANKARIPNSESVDYNALKEETFLKYLNTLKSRNPGVEIISKEVDEEIKGYKFLYKHSFNMLSKTPLKSSTNRLMDYMNKIYVGNMEMPDFIIEGGNNAETVAHVYRHHLKDKYSLMASAMVMEDQERVKDIIDGKYKPELFQGLQNRVPACKRFAKKLVAPGIIIVGREEGIGKGFYATTYSMDHLAKVGAEEVKLEDMKFEDLSILSDVHIGKGEVRYDKLKSAISIMRSEIGERKAKGESSPPLFIVNESLQGRNYKTMAVETKRSMPEEFEEKLRAAYESGGDIEKIIAMSINELDRTNEPRLMNQLERYNQLINPLVLDTLANSKYETAVILNEGTHIQHTVGEFGITETELETYSFKAFDLLYRQLVKQGILPENNELASMYGRIKSTAENLSGCMSFEEKIGEIPYKFSTAHKAGSAKPESNIPMKLVERSVLMRDDADINISGHLHMPFFAVIGRLESNTTCAFYKGETFNEYDDFGKLIGWPPAVIGYVKATVPTNENGKGVYGVHFITSDSL
jgi:hypothetical protein